MESFQFQVVKTWFVDIFPVSFVIHSVSHWKATRRNFIYVWVRV